MFLPDNTIPPLPPAANRRTITENIPERLRRHDQFILYKTVSRNGKLLKLPYSPYDPHGKSVDPLDPSHWASFEEAVAVLATLDQSQFGLGFVLTPWANVTCVDVDGKDDPAGVEQWVHRHRADVHGYTWAERSVSGLGYHFWYIGTLPDGLTSIMPGSSNPGWSKHVEVYSAKRFIALTGDMIEHSAADLTDGAGFISDLGREYLDRRKPKPQVDAKSPPSGVTYELGRGHMSDERALLLLSERKADSYAHLCQSAPEGQGSNRLQMVVGDLDKILADPDQIFRIIEDSPLGRSRQHSLGRKFWKYWLPDARRTNDQGIWNRTAEEQAWLIEQGKLIEKTLRYDGKGNRLEGVTLTPEEKAQREAEQVEERARREAAEAEDASQHDEVFAYLMRIADPARRSRPSSRLQRFIDANVRGMRTPLELFATVATVATMGGICGANYRTSDGLTTTMNLLLVAISSAGKGEAFEYWMEILEEQSLSRLLLKGKISSVEGLHQQLQRQRTCLHYRAEARGDLAMIAKPTAAQHVEIANAISTYFDMANFGKRRTEASLSLKAIAEGRHQISGVRYSMLWTCTPDAFNNAFTAASIGEGMWSRALTFVHKGRIGRIIPERQLDKRPPNDILEWIQSQIDRSILLNSLYERRDSKVHAFISNPNILPDEMRKEIEEDWGRIEGLTPVVPYSDAARQLSDKIDDAVSDVRQGLATGKLSPSMTPYARIGVMAKKLALLDTIIGDAHATVISEESMAWGARFAIECMETLATWFEEGGGDSASDEKRRKSVVRWLNARKPREMALWELQRNAASNGNFKSKGRSDFELALTLKNLEEAGVVGKEKKGHGWIYKIT